MSDFYPNLHLQTIVIISPHMNYPSAIFPDLNMYLCSEKLVSFLNFNVHIIYDGFIPQTFLYDVTMYKKNHLVCFI